MSDENATRVAWLLPVALAAVVWFPITRNYFHFDDFLDLYQLRNDEPAQYFLRMYGGHLLIARHAVTAGLDAIFGPNPLPFFAVMLATHLVNTGLLYALVARLTGSWPLAVVAAAVWGTSPVNEGALGWYAVYGQVAATTCILAVLAGLARPAGAEASRWAAPVGWALLMLLAGLLFGVGIAAALVMPGAAWLLMSPGAARRRTVGALTVTAATLLATYVAVRSLELPLYGEQRSEMVMMIGGLAPAYVGAHLQLLGALLGFGAGALPLGPLVDPNRYPSGVHIAALAAVGMLLAAGGWAGSPTTRRRLCACLLLVLGIYGLIAVARSMLIGWVGLWPLARSLRFHYGAGALLVAAVAVAAGACAARWAPPSWMRQALVRPRAGDRDLDGVRRHAADQSFRRRPQRDGTRAGRDPRRAGRGAAGCDRRNPQSAVRLRRLPQRGVPRPLSRHRRDLRDLLSRRRRRRAARGVHQRRPARAPGPTRRPARPESAA